MPSDITVWTEASTEVNERRVRSKLLPSRYPPSVVGCSRSNPARQRKPPSTLLRRETSPPIHPELRSTGCSQRQAVIKIPRGCGMPCHDERQQRGSNRGQRVHGIVETVTRVEIVSRNQVRDWTSPIKTPTSAPLSFRVSPPHFYSGASGTLRHTSDPTDVSWSHPSDASIDPWNCPEFVESRCYLEVIASKIQILCTTSILSWAPPAR